MTKQEKENLINSLGQKEGHKSLWARTRVIALVFNSLIAGFDRGVGSVAHYVRTSDQRKVFKVRRQTIRKAKRDKAAAARKVVIDESISKARASVSSAVNSVKTSASETATAVKKSVNGTTAAVKKGIKETTSAVKKDVNERVSAVKKSVTDKVEASKAKLEESKRLADAEKERKLAEKLARAEAEKERLAAEQALRAEEESQRAAEFARSEAERVAEAIKNAEEEEKNKEIDAALKQAEIERARESRQEIAERIKFTAKKYTELIKRAKETRTAQIEKRRYENAALFRADEELKFAKQFEARQTLETKKEAKRQALEAKKEAERQKREEIERQKLEQERIEAERLKAEADRLEAERLAQEEADRIKAEKLEAERREIAQRQQIEAERIRAERVAREEAERQETEKQKYTKNAIATAIAKADEQRRIALVQNKKLERLFRINAFKESIISKYNNAINFAATRAAEVKEHAQSAKENIAHKAMDNRAAAAEKAATAKAIRLANSLAERARSEELANEKTAIRQEKERIAQAAAEALRIEKEKEAEAKRIEKEKEAEAKRIEKEKEEEARRKEAEALRIERERKEAEREASLAQERAKKNAIDTALKLADDARNDAIEFERQTYARLKEEEKQQKVLERQVDAELKKLRKEADKFAADEKKKEESAARKQERDEANFARRKRSLRRAKKFEKSSARLQRSAQTTFHKWSMYLLHIIICIVVSAITCFFVMWIQPSSTMHFSGLWLLNFWPVLITGVALAFLCQNAFISGAINLVLWSLLSMANTIKVEVRDDPVYPSDLLLIKEAFTASSEYRINIPTDDIGILIGCVVALLICGIVYTVDNRGKIAVIRSMAGKTKCAIVRFGGFVVSIITLAAVVLGVYSSNELYQQFDLENYDHVSEVYSSLGFPLSFCHYAKAYFPQKPEGYNEAEAMFYGQNIKTETNDPKVHVIMIMDEAYSDLTDLGIMNFNEDNDPQFMFKEMAKSKNAISGHIVVPGFAGGTAYTEFDVVTGMQTNMLADSNITAFRTLKDKEESLMSVLHGAGYTTQFAHVGDPWYYNRENAYKLLGADEILFKDKMTDIGYKGFYISDDYVAQLIEDRFNKAVYNNEWLFSYNVTIQNHMAYTADKYAGWTLDNVDVMATLTKDTQDAINAYTEGIRDANYMLYRLYNFFNETDEPVMLVFFGDHMPYLGDGMKGYKELGIDNAYSDNKAAALKMYETPYLIWCNDAGAKALDFENAAKDLNLPQDGVIQASYLGSVVLDLIGEGDISQWFSYLSEARQDIPVTKFVTEENEYIDRLRKWTYYKITN